MKSLSETTNDTLNEYYQLLAEIDQSTKILHERFPSEITCHLGCTGCCQQHLSVCEVEAENLRQFIGLLNPELQAQLRTQALATLEREAQLANNPNKPVVESFPPDAATSIPCPALINGACSVYEARPVICRTHGFPLLYVDEDTQEALLDVCPLNFSEAEEQLENLAEDEVLLMHTINEYLVGTHLRYLQKTTGDVSAGLRRRSLAEIILIATTPKF